MNTVYVLSRVRDQGEMSPSSDRTALSTGRAQQSERNVCVAECLTLAYQIKRTCIARVVPLAVRDKQKVKPLQGERHSSASPVWQNQELDCSRLLAEPTPLSTCSHTFPTRSAMDPEWTALAEEWERWILKQEGLLLALRKERH